MAAQDQDQARQSRGKRRARAHRDLLDKGLALIGRQGVAATKVEQITAAAGVGKGTFFTHFSSKEAFVARLVETVLDDLARRVRPLGLMPTDAGELLAGVGAVHVRYFQLRPEAAALIMQAPALPPEHEASGQARRRLEEHLTLVADLVGPACDSIGWPQERARDLALMILATATGYFWFGRQLAAEQATPADLLDRLGRALGRGLARTTSSKE